MTLSPRRLSRTMIAVTAAAAPVVTFAPAVQAAPSTPQLPQQPLLPNAPTTPVTTPRVLPTPAPTSTVTMRVDAAAGVNVRSGPSTSYGVVGGYRQGAQLTGTLTSNNWLKIAPNRFVAAWNLTRVSGGGGEQPDPAPSGVTQWMEASIGNVRSGPGLGHPVVTTMRKGTRVQGSWTSNGWLNIGGGKYISGTILTGTDPGGGGGEQPQPSPTRVTQWMQATLGNVRSGPGLGHPVVTTMRQGTQVQGTWTSNGWLSIGGGKYISRTILTGTDPGGGGGEQPAPSPTQVTRWVGPSAANVRSGPSTSYSIVGSKARGTRVTGTLTGNGWLKMSGSQYMAESVLTATAPGGTTPGPTPTPAPAPAPAPSQLRQQILTTAAKYIGTPYKYGGNTPQEGFDCSGYTKYVFAEVGLTIPRTAAMQQAATTRVSTPLPGDLVFFGSPAYHVGIYAGDGMMYDTGRPGVPTAYRAIFSGVSGYGRVNGVG